MAGQPTPRKHPPSPNGAPTLTPLGHYAGRPDIALSRQVTVVGSKTGSRLHLASSTVSQSHALIVNSTGGAYVRDLASRTHVYVNGKDHREADLNDGDLLQIGKFKFQFNEGVTGAGVEPGRSAPVGGFDTAPGALLNIEGGEMPLPIESRTILIGRRPTCDIPLIEETVSTAHAVIFEMNGKRFIRDLGSRTGIFINGRKVEQQGELKFGDTIRIGETDIVYSSASGEVAEREPDELDHLVSTAPLGTAALEAPGLDDDATPGTSDDDAIPMVESRHREPAASPSGATPEPEPVAPDEVDLASDPDVSGGPGDTAFLPPQVAPLRKVPTLKADVVAEVTAEVNAPDVATPSPEDAAVVDDALGLTPEARRREAAKIDELSASRRGWRGMQADEAVIPMGEPPAPVDRDMVPPAAEEALTLQLPAVAPTPELEPTVDQIEPTVDQVEPTVDQMEPVTTPEASADPQAVQVAAGPVAADALDIEIEEPSRLAVEEAAISEAEEQLHLPPVIDDRADEVEPLPLTPEEGAPLDLSVEEPTAMPEEFEPVLDLKDPQPVNDVPAGSAPAPTRAREPEPEPESEPEPVAEALAPASQRSKKPKKPRAPRKKKGASEPIVEVTAVESEPAAPAPEAEPVGEPIAPPTPAVASVNDAVEVFEETQPTPESALNEDAVAEMLAEPFVIDDASGDSELTDTGFGRAVDSFTGESTGPLVEAGDEEPPVAEPLAPHAAVEEVPFEPEPAAEALAEDAPVPVELTDPQIMGGPTDDAAAAIEDLVSDALAEEPSAWPEKVDAPQLNAEASDLDIEELNLAADELDLAAEEAADAQRALADDDTEFAVRSPAATTVEPESQEEPEPEPQPVAQAPQPTVEEREPEPEPLSRDEALSPPLSPPPPPPPPAPKRPAPPPPSRAPAPMVWGPNQEHFLGGMPLKLNKPTKPVGPGQAAARQGSPFMPAPPPRATRPNARTRSPFDVAPPDVPATDLGASIPPFAGKSAKAGQVTTGFDGLAMPPVRETDVFSQMAPGAFAAGLAGGSDDDIFSRGARVPGRQPPQQQQQQQQRGVEQPPPQPQKPADDAPVTAPLSGPVDVPSPADAVWADDPAHAIPDPEDESQTVGAGRGNRPLPTPPAFPSPQPVKRKRRWFGIRFLLIVMVLLSLAAVGGIYALVKEQTTVVGRLRFANFPSKAIERDQLLKEQQKLVADHTVRDAARRLFEQQHPGLAPGFLADPIAYELSARKAEWASGQSGALAFPYNGRDQQGDRQRVAAVLLALYDANGKNVGEAGTLRTTVAGLNAARDKSQRRVTELKEQIDRLNVTAMEMPERKRVEEVTAEAARLEKEHAAAARHLRDANLDLERMRQNMPGNPQPAGTAQAPVVDPELAKLQEELTATNQKVAAAKAARAKNADEARVALDAALASFEKQIAGAQGLANDNPELSAYVAAAGKLQTETRELTDGLIRRQQEQQRRLVEMKTRLAEKLESRRADVYKRDPELKKLGDELAIVQRQHSAAESAGMKKEADDLKAQVDLLSQMIKARQTLVGDDQFYADAINQLQKLIDDQQRSLEGDRKHTEAQLERMQSAFAKSQPAVEKMPEAQRELAASLSKQLEDINGARRKYNTAADAVAAAGDEEMKKAEAAAAALTAKIEARRKDLTAQAEKAATAEQEQTRLAALKTRESEFAAAQTAEADASAALAAAQKSLRELQSTEAEAREAGEKRDALQTERVSAQKELEAQLRQLELKQSEAGRTAEPIPPADSDVDMKVHDPRPTFALASVGGIVAVFVVLILLTSNGGSAGEPIPDPTATADTTDIPMPDRNGDRTAPKPMPRPSDGNGSPAADAPRMAV